MSHVPLRAIRSTMSHVPLRGIKSTMHALPALVNTFYCGFVPSSNISSG